MGPSNDMAKRGGRVKVLSARVDPELHRRIRARIAESGATVDQFVQDAVLEKLQRARIETTDVGVMRDLSAEDRERIQWIADSLREHPEDALLREVLTAQRGVLIIVIHRE